MKTIRVELGERSYPIYIGVNLLEQCAAIFKKRKVTNTVVIITDTNVARLYLSEIKQRLEAEGFRVFSITIPSGEKQKNLSTVYSIFTKLLQWKVERKSTIVALGGGVIGDLAGFAAATYQRGVDFVQIPTTLLAQVDSSVGGKTGVNHHRAKNMIGAFYQPKFVLSDISVLKTLPKREIICGLGEIVKYGIIIDKKFFEFTAHNLKKALAYNEKIFSHFVAECCAMKSYVVSHDEHESGLRAILNFGHTVGHALEQAGKYKELKHGEAILYGMLIEAEIAVTMNLLSRSEFKKIELLIRQIPLPKLHNNILNVKRLLRSMENDKKSTVNAIRMVLPETIGKTTLPIAIDRTIAVSALRRLQHNAV